MGAIRMPGGFGTPSPYQSPYGQQSPSGAAQTPLYATGYSADGGAKQRAAEDRQRQVAREQEQLAYEQQKRQQEAALFQLQKQAQEYQLHRQQNPDLIQLDMPGGGGMTRANWEQMMMNRDAQMRENQARLQQMQMQGSGQSKTVSESKRSPIDIQALQALLALMPGRV